MRQSPTTQPCTTTTGSYGNAIFIAKLHYIANFFRRARLYHRFWQVQQMLGFIMTIAAQAFFICKYILLTYYAFKHFKVFYSKDAFLQNSTHAITILRKNKSKRGE